MIRIILIYVVFTIPVLWANDTETLFQSCISQNAYDFKQGENKSGGNLYKYTQARLACQLTIPKNRKIKPRALKNIECNAHIQLEGKSFIFANFYFADDLNGKQPPKSDDKVEIVKELIRTSFFERAEKFASFGMNTEEFLTTTVLTAGERRGLSAAEINQATKEILAEFKVYQQNKCPTCQEDNPPGSELESKATYHPNLQEFIKDSKVCFEKLLKK